MAQTYHIKDLTNDADTNTATPPQGAPEGMQRTAVNNTMREMMGAIRSDWDGSAPSGGSQWRDVSGGNTVSRVSSSQLTIGVLDLTPSFPIGRKVKLLYPSGNSGYAFVSAVSFGGGNTTITVADFDDTGPDNTVRTGITNCLMASGFGGVADHGIGKTAYESLTEEALTTAYTAADAVVTAAYTAADVVVTNAYTAADSGFTSAFTAADVVVTNAYVAADAVVTAAYIAADLVAGRGFEIPTAFTGTAINAAISASSVSKNSVLLQEGTYNIDVALVPLTGTKIVGAGIGSTILLLDSATNLDVIRRTATLASDVWMSGFTIDGNGSAQTTAGIGVNAETAARWTLDSIRVTNCWAEGILFAATSSETYLKNVHVDDNCTGGGASGFQVDGGGRIVDCSTRMNASFGPAANFGVGINITGFDVKIHSQPSTSGLRHGGVDLTSSSASPSAMANFRFEDVTDPAVSTAVTTVAGALRLFGEHARVCNGVVVDWPSGDGLELLTSAGTTSLVTSCAFHSVGGHAISGAGPAVLLNNTFGTAGISPFDPDMAQNGGPVFIEGGSQNNIPANTESRITDMDEKAYPQPPNGKRRFIVELKVTMNITSAGSNTITTRVRSGTLGGTGLSNAIIMSNAHTDTGILDAVQFSIGPQVFTPLAGERLTASIEVSANSTCDIRENGYNNGSDNFNRHTYLKVTYLDR